MDYRMGRVVTESYKNTVAPNPYLPFYDPPLAPPFVQEPIPTPTFNELMTTPNVLLIVLSVGIVAAFLYKAIRR
jgi:hypothetical protein